MNVHGAGAGVDAADHRLGIRQAHQRARDRVATIVGGRHRDRFIRLETLSRRHSGRRVTGMP